MSDEELYRIARAQVEQKRGFWIHLSVYAIVNTGLALLNLATSPGSFWFVFPLIGWGIGLVAHGVYVFLLSGRYGPEWEERQVRRRRSVSGGRAEVEPAEAHRWIGRRPPTGAVLTAQALTPGL